MTSSSGRSLCSLKIIANGCTKLNNTNDLMVRGLLCQEKDASH